MRRCASLLLLASLGFSQYAALSCPMDGHETEEPRQRSGEHQGMTHAQHPGAIDNVQAAAMPAHWSTSSTHEDEHSGDTQCLILMNCGAPAAVGPVVAFERSLPSTYELDSTGPRTFLALILDHETPPPRLI